MIFNANPRPNPAPNEDIRVIFINDMLNKIKINPPLTDQQARDLADYMKGVVMGRDKKFYETLSKYLNPSLVDQIMREL